MPQISDHNTVFLEVSLKAKTIKKKPRKIHLYNKGYWPAIQKGLADILDSLGTLQNINDMWLLFKTKCLDLMDSHIPTELAKVRNGLPWVNQNLKRAIRCHNRAWSKWKKSNSQTAHSHYLRLKKYVQHSFYMAYWNYINDLISWHNEDGKHQGQKWFWSYIKSLKQDYSGVSLLKHNGKLVTDSIGKAEVLNTQFQSVFTQDPDGDPPSKGPSPHPEMPSFQIGVAVITKLI